MPKGILRKMKTELTAPVQYDLRIGDEFVRLNEYLGKDITFEFLGAIYCVQCGRKTNKSFQQGHCFPCMRRINECDNCMLHPERCHVESEGCPEDDWAHTQCHANHLVYLANSSGLKVGITRDTQVPTRWIDQGAIAAVPILTVQNRYQSGLVEVAIKEYANDKTNWRAMLKNEVPDIDLTAERERILTLAADDIKAIQSKYDLGVIEILDNEPVVHIEYPVLSYPEKVKSLSFDKTAVISGELKGIKGQYLYIDDSVINIRKFGGYEVVFNA